MISIPAPAQGATLRLETLPTAATDFNPRPRAGGDIGFPRSAATNHNFNPRPRAGGDAGVTTHPTGTLDISIPAPAQGATAL